MSNYEKITNRTQSPVHECYSNIYTITSNEKHTPWNIGVKVRRVSAWEKDGFAYFTTALHEGPILGAYKAEVTKD
jgi:hypothetical protein